MDRKDHKGQNKQKAWLTDHPMNFTTVLIVFFGRGGCGFCRWLKRNKFKLGAISTNCTYILQFVACQKSCSYRQEAWEKLEENCQICLFLQSVFYWWKNNDISKYMPGFEMKVLLVLSPKHPSESFRQICVKALVSFHLYALCSFTVLSYGWYFPSVLH